MQIAEATVEAASSGFGMYERHIEGPQVVEDCHSLDEWQALVEDANPGAEVLPAPEIDGKIYNQGGGIPYKLVWPADRDYPEGRVAYCLVYRRKS